MEFEYLISNKKVKVSINKKNKGYEININDEQIQVQPIHFLSNFMSLINKGIYQKIYFAKDNGILYLFINGQQYCIEDFYQAQDKSIVKDQLILDSASEICSPMPGKILKILVNVGDEVKVKQNLVIVEAMKMENSIYSSIKGIVKHVNFKEGDLVNTGQPILELEIIE